MERLAGVLINVGFFLCVIWRSYKISVKRFLMTKYILLTLMYVVSISSNAEENIPVIKDGDIVISSLEVKEIMKAWPKELRNQAKQDEEIRIDFIAQSLRVIKISKELDNVLVDEKNKSKFYAKISLDNFKAKMMLRLHAKDVVVPDMTDLAEEMYTANKETIGKVPVKRKSSHILIACQDNCDEEEARRKTEELHKKLKMGEDFEKMVGAHSDDPGSKARKGSLAGAVSENDQSLVLPYLKGLFSIEEIGGYSDIVRSKFGFHIIRLDDIEESYHLPFKEVKETMIQKLENRYKEAEKQVYLDSFSPSGSVIYDKEKINELFEAALSERKIYQD